MRVDSGAHAGDVFEYKGATQTGFVDLSPQLQDYDDTALWENVTVTVSAVFDYTSTQTPATLEAGKRVKIPGGTNGLIYKYVGATPLTGPEPGAGLGPEPARPGLHRHRQVGQLHARVRRPAPVARAGARRRLPDRRRRQRHGHRDVGRAAQRDRRQRQCRRGGARPDLPGRPDDDQDEGREDRQGDEEGRGLRRERLRGRHRPGAEQSLDLRARGDRVHGSDAGRGHGRRRRDRPRAGHGRHRFAQLGRAGRRHDQRLEPDSSRSSRASSRATTTSRRRPAPSTFTSATASGSAPRTAAVATWARSTSISGPACRRTPWRTASPTSRT